MRQGQRAGAAKLGLPGHSSYFTGDLLVDSLLSEEESHWGGAGLYDTPATITYSQTPARRCRCAKARQCNGPGLLQNQSREQLDELEALANLTFVEVPDTGSFNAATGGPGPYQHHRDR